MYTKFPEVDCNDNEYFEYNEYFTLPKADVDSRYDDAFLRVSGCGVWKMTEDAGRWTRCPIRQIIQG